MNRRDVIKAAAASSVALVGGISLGNAPTVKKVGIDRAAQIYFDSKIIIESHSTLEIRANVLKWYVSEQEEKEEDFNLEHDLDFDKQNLPLLHPMWSIYKVPTNLDIFRIFRTKCFLTVKGTHSSFVKNFAGEVWCQMKNDHYFHSNPDWKTRIKTDYGTTGDVLDCLWKAVHFGSNYCVISFDIL